MYEVKRKILISMATMCFFPSVMTYSASTGRRICKLCKTTNYNEDNLCLRATQ